MKQFFKKIEREDIHMFGAMFLVGILFVAIFPYVGIDDLGHASKLEEASVHEVLIEKEAADPFDEIELEAIAAYVFDIRNDVSLFAHNENERLPLASVTKVMTAVIASDLIPKSTVVTVHSGDIALDGDSGLHVGEQWRLSDLIDFTLTTSSNDGASAIASVAGSYGQVDYGMSVEEAKSLFVAAMNEKAVSIPLPNTVFFNETGLDVDDVTSGAYGTAKDMTTLFAYAVRNYQQIFESTSYREFVAQSLSEISHSASNTNEMIGKIPGLIASKTGFTDLAGGNLVVVFDAGLMRPIAISILGSSEEGRFSDMKKLVDASVHKVSTE
ncbi:MAG: hypothetical protein COZ49_02500 [Candidatus Yonathbacteria bacterium CG_4_10_14_3_um_filter_47_65]|uniref:Peptidase S11 D-alanyl-D-alanine carboxypeptidase A N-terminal domain-containing protein n=2 Tax=Parcubacteria group TaxID=1794811 RepID=A0A2M8D686_9BACT|nr:MAG: hypothetical protein AUJ44_01725 [Candidatus Nomurabacteria bacterium CG1_02_47_685]PIP03578.1 MAG: hypothetical protein COX54_03025 [Candidatus Yonathbacteria bacterium CG23_combo_of_CG06-09_8_20_14_all_46_18]PIQ31399.1 MAG: hypothetical protein COW61_03760 [Candidatus Yonathbacteria bacterium CG17_big_fil_post_rev_8_21_14_2_50_46_19]PIX56356.1 MAG: hypothetical protein COZ49_02500 [Candidatus Yonathbacteria bacterium CG_4_10_14_3_um_filter_47_65]PIY57504.1 MAG: hypothetical protein CO